MSLAMETVTRKKKRTNSIDACSLVTLDCMTFEDFIKIDKVSRFSLEFTLFENVFDNAICKQMNMP